MIVRNRPVALDPLFDALTGRLQSLSNATPLHSPLVHAFVIFHVILFIGLVGGGCLLLQFQDRSIKPLILFLPMRLNECRHLRKQICAVLSCLLLF